MKKVLFVFVFFNLLMFLHAESVLNFQERSAERFKLKNNISIDIEYEALRNTVTVDTDWADSKVGINITKGSCFYPDVDIYVPKIDYDANGNLSFCILMKNLGGANIFVKANDFIPVGSLPLPEEIINSNWTLAYDYDVLQSKDRNTLAKYEWWINIYEDKIRDYADISGESCSTMEWYETISASKDFTFTNSLIKYSNFAFFSSGVGYVSNIKENTIKVIWVSANHQDNYINCVDSFIKGKESIISFTLDGDYLIVDFDGNSTVLAKKCINFDEQWMNIINDNTCDLSKIKWPCHADGTCDYETKKH